MNKNDETDQAISKLHASTNDFEVAVARLHAWQEEGSTSFTSWLYMLIAKADGGNRLRLAAVFPDEVAAYLAWCGSGDNGRDLFRQYGLIPEERR